MITTRIQILTIVNRYLEDVAEDPLRLEEAMNLADREITEVLAKDKKPDPSPATNYS